VSRSYGGYGLIYIKMGYILKQIVVLTIFNCILKLGTHVDFVAGENTGDVQPLRVYPFYSQLKNELDENVIEVLKETLGNVALYVRKLLSVVPVKGNLLLKRDACKSQWTHGRNSGKCAQIRKDYNGEICQDSFVIPDRHLEAFYTWTHEPLPDKTWFTDGIGIAHADFVLYVQASTTRHCLSNFNRSPGQKIIAYASYCKLDKSGRPIAGYINFCPSELRLALHDKQKLRLIALHELFHALGFSKDLILTFRDCRKAKFLGEECPVWSYPIIRTNGPYHLMLTPTVVQKMQEHFSCSETDFGAPFMSVNGDLTSHWDPQILGGSIMAPSFDDPYRVFVDPITLAVFNDMGWYKVNFSSADAYPFRKDGGCDFKTLTESDKSVTNYCSFSYYRSFCDNWNSKTVINCSQSNNQVSEIHDNCDRFPTEHGKLKRCLQESTSVSTQGRCFTVKCLRHNDVWVEVGKDNWLQCPEKGRIQLTYADVDITCPVDKHLFCYERQEQVYLQDLVRLESTTVTQKPYVTQNLQNIGFTSGIDRGRDLPDDRSFSGANKIHSYSNIYLKILQTILLQSFLLFILKMLLSN